MALRTRSRREKPLAGLNEKSIRERVEQAEATIREIDALEAREVVASGKQEETLERYKRAIEVVDAGKTELASRTREATIANMPVARGFRDEQDARRAREKRFAPVLSALEFVLRRGHPELRGAKLVADRLSESEGQELVALVRKARALVFEEGAEPLDEREEERYRVLVGKTAGNEHIFDQKRRKSALTAKRQAIKEEQRVASLPRRPQLAEPGSIELPRLVYSWLASKENVDGRWTVMDVGTLGTLLLAFENRDASLVAGARFEEEDGELVLVIAGGIGSELRFRGAIAGSSISETDTSGFVRLRPALMTLVRNKWFSVEVTAAETRIRFGELARKARGHTD